MRSFRGSGSYYNCWGVYIDISRYIDIVASQACSTATAMLQRHCCDARTLLWKDCPAAAQRSPAADYC